MQAASLTASAEGDGEPQRTARLPTEVWVHVFGFLDDGRDVGRLALVCSEWRSIGESDALWRRFVSVSASWPDVAAWLLQRRRRRGARARPGSEEERPMGGGGSALKRLWAELAPSEAHWHEGLCSVTVTEMPKGRPVECLAIDELHGRLILGTKGGPLEVVDLPAAGSETGPRLNGSAGGDAAKQQRRLRAAIRNMRSAHNGPVRALQMSPDGALLASATAREVHVWDAETFERWPIATTGSMMAFAPHGAAGSSATNILLTAQGLDTRVKVWDANDGSLLHSLAPASPDGGGVASLATEPTTVAVGYASGDIDLFCLETGKLLLHLTAAHSSWCWLTCMQLRPGVLVSGSIVDEQIVDWDLRSGKPAHVLEGNAHSLLLHGPDHEHIISAGKDSQRSTTDQTVRIWSRSQGACVQTLTQTLTEHSAIHGMQLRYLPTQSATALVTGEGSRVRLWELDDRDAHASLRCESRSHELSVLAASDRFIAAATWDARVVVYDFEGSAQSIRLTDQDDSSHEV